jgi:hypothetical protein
LTAIERRAIERRAIERRAIERRAIERRAIERRASALAGAALRRHADRDDRQERRRTRPEPTTAAHATSPHRQRCGHRGRHVCAAPARSRRKKSCTFCRALKMHFAV